MMTKTGRVIQLQVLSHDEGFLQRLFTVAASSGRIGDAVCEPVRVQRLEPSTPDKVLVIDLDSLSEPALQEIIQFRESGGRAWIAVTYQQPSSERLLHAMRAGANDYLSYSPSIEEFRAVMARAARGQPDTTPLQAPGRIISVFSNKGGVGTTMVAINAAASLAALQREPVVVVDLVLQHGDIALFLDSLTNCSVVSLVKELDRADASFLRSILPRHEAGMYVLPAPSAADEAELISSAQVNQLLAALRTAFAAVVIDAGNEFNDQTLAALDVSDQVVLVTLPNLPSIRNTRRGLELFERLHYDPSKLIVTVNRADAQDPLGRETMEEALGRPIQWNIPNDYATVVKAVNHGTALRLLKSGRRLADNIDRFVKTHLLRDRPEPPHSAARPAVWRQIFGVARAMTRGFVGIWRHGTT